jgi:hypothetical protein
MVPKLSVDEFLASAIVASLEEHASSVCIIENAVARPGDDSLARAPVENLVVGSEIYHLIQQGTPQVDVGAALRFARSYRLMGVVTGAPTPEVMDWENVFHHTFWLFIDAFDGEGALIWGKQGLNWDVLSAALVSGSEH